jgi:hypothetical protein
VPVPEICARPARHPPREFIRAPSEVDPVSWTPEHFACSMPARCAAFVASGQRLFDKLRAGDTMVVRWVDRLGRNLRRQSTMAKTRPPYG